MNETFIFCPPPPPPPPPHTHTIKIISSLLSFYLLLSLISHSFPARLIPFSPLCFTFFFIPFLSLFSFSFTQAVPCFVSHLETQAASNSNIFQQQVLAKALAATRSAPQTELCYWVNKGQLESWRNEQLSHLQRALKEWENYIPMFGNTTD